MLSLYKKIREKIEMDYGPVTNICHIGSGRMGSVYKVTYNKGENLCVKILTKNHPTKHQDSIGWKLAYKDLDFKFNTYEDNQNFYFTAPYFEGELFHYAIRYNLKSRFEIIQDLIKKIKEIHHKFLIHRDLKCSNIIIHKNKVYIIDLGRCASISKDSSSLFNLSEYKKLPHIKFIPRYIISILQPFTAPEYYEKETHNKSTVGFRSDYYSIAQLFRFLIPEYSYLADEVIITKGIDRNAAFEDFSKNIDDILKQNESNLSFNESDKTYSETMILYRKIIFFIKEILNRLSRLIFQSTTLSAKQKQSARIYNEHLNTSCSFFKSEQKDLTFNPSYETSLVEIMTGPASLIA